MVSMTKLVGTIVGVAVIMMASFTVLSDTSDNYAVNMSDDLQNTSDTYQQEFTKTTNLATNAKNTTEGAAASPETTSGFEFQAVIATVKLLFDSIGIIGNMASEFMEALGIPGYFKIALTAVVSIVVILMFLAAAFGKKVES